MYLPVCYNFYLDHFFPLFCIFSQVFNRVEIKRTHCIYIPRASNAFKSTVSFYLSSSLQTIIATLDFSSFSFLFIELYSYVLLSPVVLTFGRSLISFLAYIFFVLFLHFSTCFSPFFIALLFVRAVLSNLAFSPIVSGCHRFSARIFLHRTIKRVFA